MQKILAKPVIEKLEGDLRARVEAVTRKLGRPPKLSVVLVGEDPASVIYVTKKGEMAVKLGMLSETVRLPSTSTPEEVRAVVQKLNWDETVDGILIQRPLPKGFREEDVLYWVDQSKDVDAFHPESAGRLVLGLPCFFPCTPHGVMLLLEHYGVDPRGKIACVIGRSSIVGKPMASLLLQKDATILQAHSRTPDLRAITKQADILIVAVGKAQMIDASYVKQGAVVIDVGVHKSAEGKTVGDVVFDSVAGVASAISPVPGGVGPMTITVLMQNTVFSAEQKAK